MRSCFLCPNSHPNSLLLPNHSFQSSKPPHFIPTFPSFPATKILRLKDFAERNHTLNAVENGAIQGEVAEVDEEDGDDDGVCPVDCVREFYTDEEFLGILERAKDNSALVVVDFYRTSCGSCKYIEQGFSKLCRGSGDEDAPVIFLKHNVIDEYDEQSEVADRLRIKVVPLFHFYKDGVLLESFATRDKDKIITAIRKYTSQI